MTSVFLRCTCNIDEIKDPGGCEKTDSTHAETRKEARLPRSPRHTHPASRAVAARRLSGQNMSPLRPLFLTPVLRFESRWPVAVVIVLTLSYRRASFTRRGSVQQVWPVISTSTSSTSQRQRSIHNSKARTPAKRAKIMNHQLPHLEKYGSTHVVLTPPLPQI